MDLMLVVTAITFGALVAWYWWQARVRRSNIEELNQATAARNKEREGSRCRMYVTQDGSVQAVPCTTSEQIEDKLGNTLLDGIGNNLFYDKSPEATELIAFLMNVYEANSDNKMNSPRDIEIAWFTCFQLNQKEPDSELARTFKSLNDAWTATRQHQGQT